MVYPVYFLYALSQTALTPVKEVNPHMDAVKGLSMLQANCAPKQPHLL